MISARWARRSGLAATVGGVLWALLRSLAASSWTGDLYTLSYEDYSRLLTLPLFLFLLATLGIYRRYGPGLGRAGQGGIVLAAVGFALLMLGNVVEFWAAIPFSDYVSQRVGGPNVWPGADTGWAIYLVGLAFGSVGMVLLGVANRGVGALVGRARRIPLFIGLTFPLAVFAGGILGVGVVFGLCWGILGFTLSQETDLDEILASAPSA